MENEIKPSVEEILGKQVISILKISGIESISLDANGSVSGEMRNPLYPETRYIKNITIKVSDNKIVIDGDSVTIVHSGKII